MSTENPNNAPPATPPPSARPLVNSQRVAYKATYAPALLDSTTQPAGRVLEKAAFIRRLGLTAAEAAALRQGPAEGASGTMANPARPVSRQILDLVARVTAAPWPGGLRRHGTELARTTDQDLAVVGHAVAALREAAAGAAGTSPGAMTQGAASPGQAGAQRDLAMQTRQLAAAFSLSTVPLPVGALHLERMEMTPVGVERGELVHSVPMTPGETVNISHKEWTVTTQTFESIITDSLEGFSETGVTDKTDLTQATESETKHSTSLDVSGSVTATYDGGAYSVTAAAAVNYSDKSDVHNTVKQSIAHSQAVTRHASARTRKEHKTSFKVSSVAGAEDLAVRTLHNSTEHAIRVDYFQLIRKWKVNLIRYGLRLTYDLVIPNPGIDLISQVLELNKIEEMLSTAAFSFGLPVTDITPATYPGLAVQYGAAADPPPDDLTPTIPIIVPLPGSDHLVTQAFEIDIPDGYQLQSGYVEANVHGDADVTQLHMLGFHAIPTHDNPGNTHDITTYAIDLATGQGDPAARDPEPAFAGFTGVWGKIAVEYGYNAKIGGMIQGSFQGKLRPETLAAWQLKTWTAFRDAAQANFDRSLALAKDRKAFLEAQIAQFDALTLRKMEHEEVMKWVLEWLLPSNPLTSSPIHDLAIDWPPTLAAERPASTVALFRLVSSATGDHFYTDSQPERDNAIITYNYRDEGVAGFVFPAQAPGTVPLYRLLDTNKRHRLYTVSQAERNDVLGAPGFTDEGVACYVYPVATADAVPLHRLYNQATGDRLYTTSDEERTSAISQYGYHSEGDACFIYPPDPAAPGAVARDTEGIEGVEPAALPPEEISKVLNYGDLIKFLQNAVEWENMLFFVFPYFWDDVENWPFKQFLMHPDPVHREFLRGGAARVVLTIRPGYEDAFVRLVEAGNSDTTDPTVLEHLVGAGKYPYVTLGQEVRNQALANYENIPPANPDPQARPLLYPIQRAAWNDMQAIIAALEAYNMPPGTSQDPQGYPPGPEAGLPGHLKQFLLAQNQTITGTADGTTITVDSWAARLWKNLQAVKVLPAGNFDDPNAKFIDPWGNPYHYTTSSAATPLLHGDYELVCYGSDNQPGSNPNDPLSEDITSWADGLLTATWYEYTPTSALDVSVNTELSAGGPPLAG